MKYFYNTLSLQIIIICKHWASQFLLINNETQNCIFRYTKFHSKMLTSFKIFQKLIKLPMNLNLHFVPMNVCKISDQYLKGKLFYFFHNINFNFNFSIRSPDQETWLPTYRVTTLSYMDQQYCLTLLGLTLHNYLSLECLELSSASRPSVSWTTDIFVVFC